MSHSCLTTIIWILQVHTSWSLPSLRPCHVSDSRQGWACDWIYRRIFLIQELPVLESIPSPSLSVSISANNQHLISHSYLNILNWIMPVCTSQSPAPRTEKDYLDAQKTQRIGNGRWCNSPVTYVAVSHICPIYILSHVCPIYILYMPFLSSSVLAMAAGLAPGNSCGCVPYMSHICPIFPIIVDFLSLFSACTRGWRRMQKSQSVGLCGDPKENSSF